MGLVRELLGAGSVFGVKLWNFEIGFFSSSAGAFFTYGIFIAVFNYIINLVEKKKKIADAVAKNTTEMATEVTNG